MRRTLIKTEVGRFCCLQVDCRAEVLTAGPVFENVWWHNTLFHGKAEGAWCSTSTTRAPGTRASASSSR